MSTKITYNIDKENRIITASMDECVFDAYDNLKKIGLDANLLLNFFNLGWTEFTMRRVYKGVAKCHPDDDWDEEKGKELAKARLLRKYYKDYAHLFGKILFKIDRFYSEVEKKFNYGRRRYALFDFDSRINSI